MDVCLASNLLISSVCEGIPPAKPKKPSIFVEFFRDTNLRCLVPEVSYPVSRPIDLGLKHWPFSSEERHLAFDILVSQIETSSNPILVADQLFEEPTRDRAGF